MRGKNKAWLASMVALAALAAGAQMPASSAGQAPPAAAPGQQQTPPKAKAGNESHITPQQAKELFSSIPPILQFASEDTRLPIKHEVKPHLTTRPEVEKYLLEKMKDDKDAKRMERSEIVLKKFGLIDADFHLQSFIVTLLDEQISAY
jgi:glucose/arabinose dehydrogenase